MSLYVCIDCPLTGTDLGEWDSEKPFFANVFQVHKSHPGFKKGTFERERTQENIENDLAKKDFFRMLHRVIYSYKGPTKCCLLGGALDEI